MEVMLEGSHANNLKELAKQKVFSAGQIILVNGKRHSLRLNQRSVHVSATAKPVAVCLMHLSRVLG